MKFEYNDGGRAAAGFKGTAGDCVTRAVAIVSGLPYAQVYGRLAAETGMQRASKHGKKKAASAAHGINTTRKWFKEYMASLGFVWTPTMLVGQGCKVHLADGELPMGRLVVSLSRHYTAVIDGVIHDTFSPEREAGDEVMYQDARFEIKAPWRLLRYESQGAVAVVARRYGGRCVYGYWSKPELGQHVDITV